MNKKQRLILAVFVPIIFFLFTLMIANSVGTKVITHATGISYDEMTGEFESSGNIGSYKTYTHHPFNLEKTWYVWLLFLTFCCFFEYKLFEDKEIISNKKNK